jgi:hypothetical protein
MGGRILIPTHCLVDYTQRGSIVRFTFTKLTFWPGPRKEDRHDAAIQLPVLCRSTFGR